MCRTIFIEAISMNDDVEVLHEFEPLLRSTVRERFDILFVCVTLFIGRTIFDLMANTILVKVVFGGGIFLHFFRFPEVDGSSVEDSQAGLFGNRNLHICTNSQIERWSNITMHYAQRRRKKGCD
jgi:hypothetical protein